MIDTSMLIGDEGSLPHPDERRVWRYELAGGDGTVHHYPADPEAPPMPWSFFVVACERWGWVPLPGDARPDHDAQH
jgi:hypothetical protein